MNTLLSAAALVLAAWPPLAAAPLTEQSLLEWEYAGSPRYAPDGSRLVYTRFAADAGSDHYQADLWLIGDAGERRLTADAAADYAPAWSPDGGRLAFLSRRDGNPQVHVLRAGGGDAVQVTAVEGGVRAFAWAPDSRRIAILARPAAEPDQDAAYVTDRLLTRRDGREGYRRPAAAQLAVVSVERPRGEPQRFHDLLQRRPGFGTGAGAGRHGTLRGGRRW